MGSSKKRGVRMVRAWKHFFELTFCYFLVKKKSKSTGSCTYNLYKVLIINKTSLAARASTPLSLTELLAASIGSQERDSVSYEFCPGGIGRTLPVSVVFKRDTRH